MLIPINSKIMFLLVLFVSLFGNTLHADSPITSTPFSIAYAKHPLIIEATEANGILSPELIQHLIHDNTPVAIKMAIINKLSWDIEGKRNSAIFLEYLISNGLYVSEEHFTINGSGDELLAMAYLVAMDDYFNVRKAVVYADLAIAHNPASLTYILIESLIKAQNGIWKNWCSVYEINEDEIEWDMEFDAVSIIFRYMNLYKGRVPDC